MTAAELAEVMASVTREARVHMRHAVARYLLDRADQYEDSCAAWHGLADAAQAMVNGDFADAEKCGELDDVDLFRRVDDMARRSQQPIGCRDPECPCKEPPEASMPPEVKP